MTRRIAFALGLTAGVWTVVLADLATLVLLEARNHRMTHRGITEGEALP